jgi:transcriptional regulator with XRE-family HTH domain
LRAAIAEAMEAAGITQRELSKKLGMPSSFINKVMKGTRPLEITELIDVARALGVEPGQLFGEAFRVG